MTPTELFEFTRRVTAEVAKRALNNGHPTIS